MENNPDEPNVLIARNNETGQVGAVVGQESDGTPKMADAKTAKLSDLVKFSKGQNPLEAFMSNFLRQAKNPSTFGFFSLPADRYEAIAPAMADMIQKEDEYAEMLSPYKVKAEDYVQDKSVNQSDVSTSEVKESPEESEENIKNTKIDPDKVDWARIEKEWGITRKDLEDQKQLEDMLYNRRSNGLVKLTTTIDGEKQELEARLSFKHNPDGSITLSPHIKKNEPQLDKPYNGYTFTEEEKAELLKDGTISHSVELVSPKTGEKEPSVVNLDKLTNEILSIPFSEARVYPKICNIDLSMKEIMQLKNGVTLRDREIITKNGRHFKADIQYRVDRNGAGLINMSPLKENQSVSQDKEKKMEQDDTTNQKKEKVYSFTDAEGNPKRLGQWYHIPIDEQKQNDYLAGKEVEVGDKKIEGQDYRLYFQFNKEEKMPETKFGILKNGEVVGFADARKVQEAYYRELRAAKEATQKATAKLDTGQTEQKNQQRQSASQEQPKKKSQGPRL